MSVQSSNEIVSRLSRATGELQAVARNTEAEIRTVAEVFENLARQTDSIMALAAAIVSCVENESVGAVLPQVQNLGSEAKRFIDERLQATAGVLETVADEVKLLRELSLTSRGQESIALEIKALSVLTNIEVAHLGDLGTDFQYLARELAAFSKSMADDTHHLASHTDSRRAVIEETSLVLSADLPRQREELARIEVGLANALDAVHASMAQLASAPAQFRVGVEDIARQIAGVVAAVQAHDITRQQIEHVQEGLTTICAKMHESCQLSENDDSDLARAYAGLTIQIYQLRAIKETVASWASQIGLCMDGILKVSASDVVGIGPMVLEQEREVSAQLAQIEALKNESQSYSERIQGNLGGLSNLMQLISEHLQRSNTVRDRLRLLTFNSIIEASRLGDKAHVISAIALSTKGISANWAQITSQSGQAMQGIQGLVKQTNDVMEAFSEAGEQRLRDAQLQTSTGLDALRTAAASAGGHAQEMRLATDAMQAKIAEIGNTHHLFRDCLARLDAVLEEIALVQRNMDATHPHANRSYDAVEVEQLFSAGYTTEREREVLRAALNGTPLPPPQTLAGNSVELF